jgi:monoamine oxidase
MSPSYRKVSITGAIIGAGLAGTLFAHRLAELHPNVDFTLFDERSRTGGRVHSQQADKNGSTREMGAEYVNEDHDTVRRWCHRLELELLPGYPASQGAPKMAFLSGEVLRTDFRSILRALKGAVVRDREKLKTPSEKDRLNNLSAEHYVNSIGLSPDDAKVLLLFLENEQCIKPEHMSASFLIEFMDFGGMNIRDNSLLARGDDRFLIANGSSSLTRALEKPITSNITLDSPLEAIKVTARGGYELHFTGRPAVLTDFVVFAIPGSAFKRVEFDPNNRALSQLGQKLKGLSYSEVEKIITEIDGDHLPILAEFQQVLSHEARGLVWQTGKTNRSQSPSQIAIYRKKDGNGAQAHSVDRTVEDLVTALHNALPTERRDENSPTVRRTFVKHWPEGGWSQPTLGYGADFCHGVPTQVGHVFIIGEHMATSDPQTMEGAMESAEKGFRAFEETFFPSSLRRIAPPVDT